MTSTPWTVTKRKRTPALVTANRPRKRTRLSEPPDTDRRRQQTLTQVQWVSSRPSSFQDETMLRPLGPDELMATAQVMSKRNSTLTQMDFFKSVTLPPDLLDDTPLHCENGDVPLIPQLDGTYDSPRKPRPRKSTNVKARDRIQGKEGPGQECLPSNKHGGQLDATGSPKQNSKRTSSRLAGKVKGAEKVLSDPATNYEYFERALSRSLLKAEDLNTPILEIQDSTASDDDCFPPASQSQRSARSAEARTPQRPLKVVLSSQSPESLPPTSRKTAAKMDVLDQPIRNPLRERSANIQLPLPKPARKFPRSQSNQAAPNSSKIVSLKLPKRRIRPPRSSVEDSQNIWSLPGTSSPEKKLASQSEIATEHRPVDGRTNELVTVQSDPLEIAGTSRVDLGLPKSLEESAEDELPSLNPTFELSHGASTKLPTKPFCDIRQAHHQQQRPDVVVRDFAQLAGLSPAVSVDREATKESHLSTPQKAAPAFIADSESEFGSPVANDTQFNEEVARRTSSPHVVSEDSRSRVSTEFLSDAANKLKIAGVRPMPDANVGDGVVDASVMPAPRLIRSSSRPPSREEGLRSDASSEEGLLPPLVLPATHRAQTQTLRVPLNDVLPSSSSPFQSYNSVTPRSIVRPASLPHPSQISTQEATQYGMSSIVVDEISENPWKTERITIKDSSSMRMALSQIPAHESGESGLNVDLGLDLSDEVVDEDELDLNPSIRTEKVIPIAPGDAVTSLAKRRRAEHPTTQSPVRTKRETSTRIQLLEKDSESVSEEEIDLDPRSSHRGLRPSRLMPHDAAQSQELTPTAGTTSTAPHSRDRSITTVPTTHNESDKLEKPADRPRSLSPSQSFTSSPPVSSGRPSPLQKQYPPLPGFNNDTQSNFTQGGHVSAAYIHRQREKGALPAWYTPKPFKVPGYTRR